MACAEQEGMEDVFKLATDFFAAVHVSHTAANKKTVTISSASFISRPHPDAKAWAKEQSQQIYPRASAPTAVIRTPDRNVHLTAEMI